MRKIRKTIEKTEARPYKKGYLIKRINMSADNDTTIIGLRFQCGENAKPYDTFSSARAASKRQEKQDQEYCPECVIRYEIIEAQL